MKQVPSARRLHEAFNRLEHAAGQIIAALAEFRHAFMDWLQLTRLELADADELRRQIDDAALKRDTLTLERVEAVEARVARLEARLAQPWQEREADQDE